MEAGYWQGRWREGKIGFHEGTPNRFLEEHVAVLEPGPGKRVLVPLCGKSIDLAFLAAHGFEVVGVELVLEAAAAFFEEAGLPMTREDRGAFVRLSSGAISIWVGDFFAMGERELGTFDALFDRAAVVALPPDMRTRYARAVIDRLTPDARGIVVTFEHDARPEGPPFSVTAAELERVWPDLERVPLGSIDVLDPVGTLKARGATYSRECAYAVRRRPRG